MGTDILMDAILDTSVVLADDVEVLDLPGEYSISVMTIAELRMGVALARTAGLRSQRLDRLAAVESIYLALPVDRRVASAYGEIAAATKRLATRPHVIDGLIAATAVAYGVPLFTRDQDFDELPDVTVVRV